jgi:hypothetical protein
MTNLLTGVISTNTPIFQNYVLSLLLSNATVINESWELELPKPIPTNRVVLLHSQPRVTGPAGRIVVDDRFDFILLDGRLTIFRDWKHWSGSNKRDPSENEEKAGNRLSNEAVSQIAREALRKMGLSEEQLKLSDPPVIEQHQYERLDGKIVRLPTYRIAWKYPGEQVLDQMYMEVSSTSRKVSAFQIPTHNFEPFALPTNYFQMLGLPTPGEKSKKTTENKP